MDILERKTLTIPFAKTDFSEDEDYYHFSGYGATFGNLDRGGDIIKSGAFTTTLKEFAPKFCYQHDMQDPIGVFTEIKEDSKGLFVRGKMRKNFEKTKWIASLIEDGAIDSMSIGFSIKKVEFDNDTETRYLTELKLYEISLVTIPMNVEAKLTGFKALNEDEKKEQIKEIEQIKSLSDVESFLKTKSFSAKLAKTLISKIKEFSSRDESEKQQDNEQRDASSKILQTVESILMKQELLKIKNLLITNK